MSEDAPLSTIKSMQRRTARRLAILAAHLRQHDCIGGSSYSPPRRGSGLVIGAVSSSSSADHSRRDILCRNFALALLAAREGANDGLTEASTFAMTKLHPDFSLSDAYAVIQHMFSTSALQQHGKSYGGVGAYKLGW